MSLLYVFTMGKVLLDFLSFGKHCNCTCCFISATCVCVFVCVWNNVCHLCRGSRIYYLSCQNSFLPRLFTKGQWCDNIRYLFHTEYEICIFDHFLLTTFFAQLLHYTKGHCEKINGFLFWLAFL